MADRGLSAGAITALGASTVEMYHLIRLDFSTPVYYTTAPYDIDYDDGDGSQTYLSNATLLRIPDMTESMKIRPQTIGIELSGASTANYILLLTEEKNIDVYITKYIPSVPEGILLFKGFTDSYQTSEDVSTGQATVKLNIANHWSNWDAVSGTYLSDTEQQRIYAGDLGLEYSKVTDFFLPWWGDNGAWDNLFTEAYFLARDGYWSFGTYVPPSNMLGDAITDASDLPDTVKLPLVYGEVGLKGTPVFRTITDQVNDVMWVVYAIAEGECDSLVDITFNDVSYTDATISPYISAYFHGGSATQAADANLVSESTLWTSAHQLKGICYVAIKYTLNEIWGGDPEPTFFIKGKKLYDPRDLSTAYSQNPALALRDYLVSDKYGKSLDATDIDGLTEAANYCETQVLPYTGAGANINLFEINGVLSTSDEVKKNVESILFTMRGHLPWVSGKYTLVIERDDDTSDYSLDEDNITGSFTVKESGLKTLANVMYYAVLDKDAGYQKIDVVSESATYLAADGRELKKSIKNKLENNRYRAQNRANTELKKTRQLITVEMTAGVSDAMQVQAGEVVDITRDTQGWSAKLFRVLDMKLKSDGSVNFTLHEYEPTVFDWDYDVETTPPANTTLPNPLDIVAPTLLTLASGTSALLLQDDGTIISRIYATWTVSTSLFVSGYNVYIKSPTDASPVFYTYVKGKDSDEVYIDNVEDGILYTVYVHAVNTLGVESAALSDTETVVGKTAAPANVTGFFAGQNGDAVVFRWDQVADLDLAGYEIRFGKTGATSWASATPLTSITRGTNVTSADVATGSWDFYIKAVDTTGNYSATATSTTIDVVSSRDVIVQKEESPFTYANSFWCEDDNAAGWEMLNKGVSVDGTKEHRAELWVVKDTVGRAVRFGLLRMRFTGSVAENIDCAFDSSTGEVSLRSGTGTVTTETLVYDTYSFYKITVTGTAADTANNYCAIEIYPAVGASAAWSYSNTAIGGMTLFRPRLVQTSAYEELIDVTYLEELSGSAYAWARNVNFAVHHTGKLVPRSQNLASADGWDTFDEFVINPYADCYFYTWSTDIDFDDTVRVWASIESALGAGVTTGTAVANLHISHRLTVGTYSAFEAWSVGTLELRYVKFRAHIDTSVGLAYISGFETTVDQLEHTLTDSAVAVASGGTTITYDTAFHNVPFVAVSVVATTAIFAVISAESTTSFHVKLFTSAGAATAGTINWEAIGI